mgnify:CR=1 FL=1
MSERKQAAVSVIIISEGKLLLIERARPPAQGMFAFPGGRVEHGETLEEAARRELSEETGLQVEDLSVFQTCDIAGPDGGFALTAFLASKVSGTLQASDDAASAAYFSIAEAMKLPMPDSMTDCIAKLLSSEMMPVNRSDAG